MRIVHDEYHDIESSMENVPAYLWYNKTFSRIPNGQKYRRKLLLEFFGWNHYQYCTTGKFHVPYLHLKDNGTYDFMHDNCKNKKYCVCAYCGKSEIGFNHHLECEHIEN